METAQAYASKKAWSKSKKNLTNARSREDFINLHSDWVYAQAQLRRCLD